MKKKSLIEKNNVNFKVLKFETLLRQAKAPNAILTLRVLEPYKMSLHLSMDDPDIEVAVAEVPPRLRKAIDQMVSNAINDRVRTIRNLLGIYP
jgi:hypothetical protein